MIVPPVMEVQVLDAHAEPRILNVLLDRHVTQLEVKLEVVNVPVSN